MVEEIEQKEELRTNVKCKRCGYSWVTRSLMRYINCPNCRTSNIKDEVKQNG